MGMFCSAADMICGEKKCFTFNLIFSRIHLAHSKISGRRQIDLLCEKEKSVVGQTQESTAGHDYFQQVVQFPESDHLLLGVNLSAQEITLRSKIFKLRILWCQSIKKGCQ